MQPTTHHIIVLTIGTGIFVLAITLRYLSRRHLLLHRRGRLLRRGGSLPRRRRPLRTSRSSSRILAIHPLNRHLRLKLLLAHFRQVPGRRVAFGLLLLCGRACKSTENTASNTAYKPVGFLCEALVGFGGFGAFFRVWFEEERVSVRQNKGAEEKSRGFAHSY
jgi:hypothetical protein